MSEYAVMPKADYVSACNSIREKTGSTEPIKSNEFVNKINQLGTSKEEQEKVIDIAENGTVEILPDEDKLLSKVTVNVAVTSGEDDFSIDDYTNILTSEGKNFAYLFDNLNTMTYSDVSKIIHNPSVTSNSTSFTGMFRNCHKLAQIPKMDTSNGTNFSDMLHNCHILTTVPEMDTFNGTNFGNMFRTCSALTTVLEIDISNATNLTYMFLSCTALQSITFKGTISISIDFGDSSLLTSASVDSIGNAVVGLTGQDSKTITLNKSVIERMSDEQKLIFTNKNWTIVSKG